jgi:D-sedoheptulose 7-phosphate isomerase
MPIKINKNNNKILFFENYYKNLKLVINNLDLKKLLLIANFLEKKIISNNNIFVAGNGGSAALANHMLCDFNKGIKISSKKKLKPKIISLAGPIEIITAISNDINYNEIFSSQLENFYKKGDCLICFSSSGQSKNIIQVIKFAKKNKITAILFQGFGKLNKEISPDYYINLKYKNYGITEDIFQTVMHSISQYMRSNFVSKNITL